MCILYVGKYSILTGQFKIILFPLQKVLIFKKTSHAHSKNAPGFITLRTFTSGAKRRWGDFSNYSQMNLFFFSLCFFRSLSPHHPIWEYYDAISDIDFQVILGKESFCLVKICIFLADFSRTDDPNTYKLHITMSGVTTTHTYTHTFTLTQTLIKLQLDECATSDVVLFFPVIAHFQSLQGQELKERKLNSFRFQVVVNIDFELLEIMLISTQFHGLLID